MSDGMTGTPVVIAFEAADEQRIVVPTRLTAWFDIESGEIVIPFTDADGAVTALAEVVRDVRVEAGQ
jgi:hypothetical protein